MLTTNEAGAGNGGTAALQNPGVQLGGIAGDIDASSFSIESFFTRAVNATNTYTTLYAFSNATTNNYLIASPGRGDGTNQFGLALKEAGVNRGNEVLLRGGVLPSGSTNVAVTTFDASAGQATLFINGVAVSQSAAGALTGFNFGTLASKTGINGNDPFADKSMGGSTDEFRLNNTTLTATQVASKFINGANNNSDTLSINNGIASGDYNDGSTYDNGVPTASQLVVVNKTKTLSSGTGLAGILRVNGTVNVNGGTLSVRGITVDGDVTSTSAAAHTINLNGGTFQAAANYFAPANNIRLNVTAASTVDSQGFSISLPGTVSGTAALTKIGSGTAAFTGSSSAG